MEDYPHDSPTRYPQTINVQLCDYIQLKLANLEEKTKLELDKIRLESLALRAEYKKSEGLIAEAKHAVDNHFEQTNQYREDLRLQAATFMTGDSCRVMIKGEISSVHMQVKVLWAINAAIILLFVSEYLRRG
jgi:hypothetical protein